MTAVAHGRDQANLTCPSVTQCTDAGGTDLRPAVSQRSDVTCDCALALSHRPGCRLSIDELLRARGERHRAGRPNGRVLVDVHAQEGGALRLCRLPEHHQVHRDRQRRRGNPRITGRLWNADGAARQSQRHDSEAFCQLRWFRYAAVSHEAHHADGRVVQTRQARRCRRAARDDNVLPPTDSDGGDGILANGRRQQEDDHAKAEPNGLTPLGKAAPDPRSCYHRAAHGDRYEGRRRFDYAEPVPPVRRAPFTPLASNACLAAPA